MKLHPFPIAACGFVFVLGCLLPASIRPQAQRSITLDPPAGLDLQADTIRSNGEMLPPEPANFRRLGEATVGQPADLHTLTLRFHQTTRITGISVSKDFKVEQGGSCVEGNVYEEGSTCRLLVRFTPQGPGTRLGKLTVTHSASATPEAFGLGGASEMAVISFIPSIITTVPGTYPSNNGLLSGAWNLTVDGGDTLYVSDTGNNAIRELDSSGSWGSYTEFFSPSNTSVTDPVGIAVDNNGNAWFSETSQNVIGLLAPDGRIYGANGAGSDACNTVTSSCILDFEAVTVPGQMSFDHSNNLFFVDGWLSGGGAALVNVGPNSLYTFTDDQYGGSPSTIAVDANDDFYFFLNYDVRCQIASWPFDKSQNTNGIYNTMNIVGGRCGFSGDGGQAGNAEISTQVSQIAFDAAGDMYFTDTNNQRVRRVDYATGVIRTIAGNGAAGYTNDGGAATSAELSSPTGLGVDSQGQVYIISGAATGQVIRKVTDTGILGFGNQVKGTHSGTQTVIVTNTGNAAMQLTSAGFSGTNSSDFSLDPLLTSCVLTAGGTLNAGQSCQIGFIFTPSALGVRSAAYVLADNSVNFTNTIDLAGTGVLPSATFTITSPANGASIAHGTSVPFNVSVTSASGPAPTGTVLTGTVQFKVDGIASGTPVTITSGTASITLTGLSGGSHTLSATYSGDSNYAAGGPISVAITDVLPNATFTITSPANGASVTYGTSVPFNASVTSASGPAPTGTVQFKVDGTAFGSPVTISSGAASTSVTGLSGGSHTLLATYSGDSNYAAGGPVSVTIAVNSAPATFTITSPTNGASIPHATSVGFNVSVTSASGPAPTGTVQFTVDGSAYGSPVTISAGAASTTVTGLSVASHTLSAAYSGDSYYAVQGPISVTITVILVSANLVIASPTAGETFTASTPIPFKVLVSPATGGPAPTGTVQVSVDGMAYGSPVTISGGAASVNVTGLPPNSHTLSATYGGDSNYAAAGPVSVGIVVTAAAAHPPIIVMSPVMAANSCAPAIFNVSVSGGSGVLPTGTVHLVESSRTVSTAALVNGKAVLSSPPLTAGTHSFTAEYAGDAQNLPAVSGAVVETVSQSRQCIQPAGRVAGGNGHPLHPPAASSRLQSFPHSSEILLDHAQQGVGAVGVLGQLPDHDTSVARA